MIFLESTGMGVMNTAKALSGAGAAAGKAAGRSAVWGRGLAARALQVAVVVAVTSSVPAAWSANKGAPASVTAASTPNLHITKVAAGSASVLNSGSLTTVTTGSSRTIINYQYLSVPAGTKLDFVQPNPNSRVLNRIEGNAPTAIEGTLTSNGAVYLVNPAGVIFGNGAVVTVGKFFAAAAHMSDADFMAGRNHFTGGSGAVTNYGTITAQQVHLVGASVANFGEIVAPSSTTGGGIVTMTAGKDVYIGESNSVTDTPHVLVRVSADTSVTAAGTGVTNSGSITAGQIRLGAGDLYAAGIYSNGVLKGKEITMNSGASSVVTTGIVDASSATGKGGNIEILGDKVGIFGGTVTASGLTGGGTVLVGGALHGGGGVQVATDTVISSGATVSADGTASHADGGTVVVFSSAWTRVDGAISATGGAGGSGGFVETSSHNQLSVSTAPTVGSGGTWLMDPTDVTIDLVANANETPTTASGTTTFDPSGDTATVSALAITTALGSGTSVVINTASPAATAGILGNITFNTPLVIVTTVGTPSLTLNASGNINVQAGDGITTTGAVPLAVNFNAGGSTTVSDNISTNGGAFTSVGPGFSLAAGNITTGGGDVILKGTGGTVSIVGNVTTGAGKFWSTGTDFTNSGAISSTTAVNILQTGNLSLGGNISAGAGTLSMAGVSVVQTAGVVTAGTAAIQTTGDDGSASKFAVKLDDANAIGALAISSTGAAAIVDVQTSGALSIGSTGALTGVPAGLPAFGAVTGVTTANGTVTVDAGGALSVASAIGTSNGTVSLTAAGNITVAAAINAGTGDVDLTASTGDINGVGAIAITAANVTLDATTGGVGIGHVVTVTSGANVSITTGGADAAGDATLGFTGVAHSGDITLTDTAGSQVGLTYTITSGSSFIINSNFGASTESLNITASSGGITSTGSNAVTADVLTLTATGAGMGATGQAIKFADSTSASFTAGGDIYVSGNLDKPTTFTTDATPRTIGVIGGAVTVGTDLAAGANNTLIIDGTLSVTLNAGKTLSGGTVYVVSAGDLALAGAITSSGNVMLQGNSVSGGGLIGGSKLGVNATGILTGVSVNLSNVSAGTIAAAGPVTLGGTVTIGTTGNVIVGSVSAFSPTGFTAFAAVSGVKGNGNNVSVTAAGNISLAQDVDGGLLGNATVNANGTTSNILETGGVVKGANINLLATGGIGANGTPVQIGTLGGIALTTTAANQTGSIYVQINNALSLGSLTVTTDAATVQTVSIAELATLSLTGSVSFGTDDVGLTGTNLSLSSGQTIAAGNVTLATTSGNLSVDGTVTGGTAGVVTLTAAGGNLSIAGNVTSGTGGTINISTTAGNISQTAGTISTSGGVVTVNAVGGSLSLGGTAITVGAGNLSLTGATGVSQTAGTISAAGGNLTVIATTGNLALGGTGLSVGAGNLSITASAGNISQTAGTIGAAGGNLTVSATGGNISLSGTTSASGGAVSVSGDTAITGGSITASTLVVSAGTSINLTGNTVGTVAAAGNGTVNFTNSGGLTIGKIGTVTGISSGNSTITVQDTTGAIAVTQAVNAGTGNATVHGSTNITGVSGSNGTVSGNVVTLTADSGDIGTSSVAVKTASSDMVLSGVNMFVAEANAISSTAGTRITVPVSFTVLNLAAPTITVTTSFGSATGALTLQSTTGNVTTSGSGSLIGSSLTVVSATDINGSGGGLAIAPGATTTVNLTASSGAISVVSSTNLDLGLVTVSDGTNPVSITAPALSTSAGFSAGTSNLVLKATGAGLDLTQTITAGNTTLITNNISTGTGTFSDAGGTVTILPFTTTLAINVSSSVIGGDVNIGQAVLQNTNAANVVIGNGTTSGTMVIGPMNLSAAVFDLSLHTSGQYDFQGTLTLQNNKTFTLDGASSIVNNFVGTDIAIGGTGTLIISNIGGDIGTLINPLTTAIAKLGGVTGTGHLFISNTGALDVTGAVTMTAGGVATSNVIATHSPLTVSAPIAVVGDLTLSAGDNAGATGDTLTVTSGVGATGNIALQAGDGIVLSGGIIATTGSVTITADHELSLTDGDNGTIAQSGSAGIHAGSVTANATTGIALDGSNNLLTTITATNTGSGNISITNSGTAGANLGVGGISSTVSGGVVSIVGTGTITQSGAITTSNGNLTARTLNNAGAAITLANTSNDLGTGFATLQTRNAANSSNAAADVSFTTTGQMHLQQVQSGANVTLVGSTIDQLGSDAIGISGTKLTVTSAGASNLTNSHNNFTTLSVTDSSTATLLYTTAASGGLTISALAQSAGGTANITNSSGNITSSAAVDVLNLNLSAVGGIALTSSTNHLSTVTATNTTGGNIAITQGALRAITVSGISQSGGGVTTVTSSSDVTLTGTISAGAGLTVTASTAGGTYTESTATITSSGAVLIIADHMAIDGTSTLTATGQDVTLKPTTMSENIAINGNESGQLGLLNSELANISSQRLTIGATTITGNVTSSGAFNLPTNVRIITTGNVDLSTATVTTTSAGSQNLEVDHGGTFAIGTATLDGGLQEFGISGSGAGGTVFLSGTLSTPDHAINFLSPVTLAGAEAINTVGSTGGDISFANGGASSIVGSASHFNLTLTAGTGNISFSSAAGTTGSELGTLQVVSANNITVQSVNAVGENTTSTGVFTINGLQTLGTGGFVETGASSVALNANITTRGTIGTGPITVGSNIALTGDRTLDSTTAGATAGGAITLNGNTTGTGNLTLIAGVSNIAINSTINIGGLFSSSGAGFINTASITSGGANITHTGSAQIHGALVDGSSTILIDAVGISSDANGSISGGTITLTAHAADVLLNGTVSGSGLFTSTGANFTNHASITSGGANITHTGSATVDGALNDGSNAVLVDAIGITTTANGTINAGTITLASHTGNVTLGAPVVGSGAFTSTGVDFKNNVGATITAHGISILHTGVVDIAANLTSIGANVTTTGSTITVEQGAIVQGNVVDMPATIGVFINDQVIAPTGYSSSGNTPFTITSTGSITTSGANALIDYPFGLVTIQGFINTGSGNLQINGLGIVSSGIGTITAHDVTLTAGSGDVNIGASVTGSGFFKSTGANFTNTATISVAGANITHTGLVTINANLTGNSSNVSISGAGILSNISGTLGGNAITLAGGVGNVTLGGALNGSSLLTVTGANFLNTANVTSVGANISMPSGAVTFHAPISSGAGDLLVTSTTVTSNANGTIGGANITLNASGAVSLGATVTGTGDLVSNGTTFSGIDISAATITLNHTGLVTFNGNVTAGGGTGTIQVTGAGLTQAAGIIDSGTLTLLGTGTFTLTDANTVDTLSANITGPLTYVNADDLIVGTAGSAPTVGITTNGGALSLTINTGDLTVSSPINTGAGAITFLTSAGSEHVNANVTTTSTFSSNGTNFTSNATITANGITLTQTGPVTINGAIAGGSGAVNITGDGISSTANGTIDAGTVTLTAGTGDEFLSGTITASGLFTSTGANFTNNALIQSAGANITQTALVTLNGDLQDGSSAVNITGVGITSTTAGTIEGGTITLAAGAGNTTLDGAITGSGLFTSTGGAFTNNSSVTTAGANITSTGAVNIDGGLFDSTNPILITGIGISSNPNGTMQAGNVTLVGQTGDVSLAGVITASGFFQSTGANFTNTANITSAGANITHTGPILIDGQLIDGSSDVLLHGPGITSTVNGVITAGNVTLTAGSSDVSLAGDIHATGLLLSTGANFTNTGNLTSAGANITHTSAANINGALIDGTNAILINAVGITSNANGTMTAGPITLTANTGDVLLNGTITATGLFTSTGVNFTNHASITSAGANITHTGSATIDGSLNDGTNAVLIDAVGITSTANGSMTTGTLTLTAHSGDISLAGVINASGLFTSTGAAFINTANITSVGANITQTGAVQIHAALDASGQPVNITGLGISSNTAGTIAGSTITLTGGIGDVNLAGNVTGTGLFTSTGVAFTNTGSITSAGANITHTGAVNIDGALIDGSSNININGAGITSNTNGTMNGSAITLTGNAGNVTLAGTIVGSGLFTSTGAAFTNTASITSAGANITHTSVANIDGALVDGTNPIFINAIGITSNANGTMQAGNITLTAHSGDVSLAGTITATGFFLSTGANFTNTANITSAGANITHTGSALIDGNLADGGNAILIDAVGITSTIHGSMQAGPVTLTAHAGDVALAGTITATGLFTSTGHNFTNTASITSAGANITHTGSATIDGALVDGSSAINISAFGITSNANGTMNAGPITLTAHTGDVSLAGTIVGSGLFTSTGVGFLNTASITSAGANLTHTGLVQIQGALIDGSSAINIIGVGIHSTVAGTMTAGPITLTGGSGDVLLAGNINASGLFTSTGVAFTNTGSITSAGANITHSGAVNIDGALADGSNAITITGAGITSNSNGTMNAGPITLTGGSGAVTLAGTITASGLFTSTGAAFTNTANITSAGALLTHTGAVNIDGALNDGSNAVTITGHGIASNSSGPITAGNITLTAGSGDVSLAGTVHGTGFFKSTGAGFLNTATITVAGANLTHTGFVQIHNAFDSTGNAVTITGQGIDSNALGIIHATTLALNSLGGDATLSGNIIATGALTSTGVGFTNNGTISAVGITLTHSGAVVIDNTMDAHTGAISITGAASINDANSTLTGIGVTLHAGGFITVGNTINAGTGPALLTSDSSSVTDTGDILASLATITAATNATASNITTTNGNISIIAPGGITLRGNLLAGTANVLVNGPATLFNDVTVVGTNATFTSSIGGGARSLTINASGLTSLGGDVGSSGAPLANLITDAPGTTTLHGSAFATGNLFILDPLTLTANSNISGGTVKFGGTIVGGGVSLAVTSTHSADFAGSIGAGAGNVLTTFSVTGATATFHGTSITTTGAQTFNAAVVLENNMVVTGTAFTFGSTIDSLSAPAGLTITGNGPLVLGGDIGTGTILGSFISTGSTGTAINHPITTTGDISIAGPITIGTTLKSTGGNVSLPGAVQMTGNTNLTANGAGGITFGLGGITGNKNLTFTSNVTGSRINVGPIGTGTNGRVGSLTFNSAGVVQLGGNIFAQNVKFGYKDGGAAPTFNPTVATIFYAKGDLIINTNGAFDMEQNQSLTVFAAPTNFQSIYGTPTGNGNLSIISNNHPITVGDISAQGSVTIDAGDVKSPINIRSRPGVQVTLSDGGTLNSPAVGITSGLTSPNALILKGTLVVIPSTGSLNQVYFSSGAATVDIANTISLQLGDVTKILDFNRTNVLTGKNFLNSTGVSVLQQVPTGLGLPPQNQVNVVPRDIQTLQPERAAAISGALKDALQEIGIYARDVRTDELIEYLVGTALYDDVPYKLDPSPQDMKVAANRLPYAPVLPTVDAYRALFLKAELDANGKPVLDDKGKPKMVVQNTIILNTFGQTWLAYKMAMKDKATPDGYRGWLEANEQANPKNASALSYLDQLRDLLIQIRSLGLTSTEYDVSKKVLLSKVRPPNMKEDDFLTAIMGPSTRARAMTAMRNGDKHPGRG